MKQSPTTDSGSPKTRSEAKLSAEIVDTQAEVARRLGVAYGTVNTRWMKTGMPVRSDGRYDIEAIRKWSEARVHNQPHQQKSGLDPESAIAKRQATELAIKKEELRDKERKNAIADGDYVPRDDVQRLFAITFSFLRDDLIRIPEEMRASFPKSVREDLVEQLRLRLNGSLRAFSKLGPKIEEMTRADVKSKAGRPLGT